jgi:hypothetical protein
MLIISRNDRSFSAEDYENAIKKKRERYDEQRKQRRERKQQENEDLNEELKRQYFEEEMQTNFSAWQKWKNGKRKGKQDKSDENKFDQGHHAEPKTQDNDEINGEDQSGQGATICWICLRRFVNKETLQKHEELSQLHKDNLASRQERAL